MFFISTIVLIWNITASRSSEVDFQWVSCILLTMFAVIKPGGKQYKVSEGDKLLIEKLEVEEGKEVVFDEVLLTDSAIGTPTVAGAHEG